MIQVDEVVSAAEVEMVDLAVVSVDAAEIADLAAASAVGAVIPGAEAPLAVVEGLTPVPSLADSMQMEMVYLTPASSRDLHSF